LILQLKSSVSVILIHPRFVKCLTTGKGTLSNIRASLSKEWT
jgi:hypothetical protein